MIEKQYECMQSRSNEDDVFYPEMSTVQLLLPCFVASLLDLHSEESVTQATTKQYQRFIHELIRSYEEAPFDQNPNYRLFCPSAGIWHMMRSKASKDMETFTKHLKQILGGQSQTFNQIKRFCLQYIHTCAVRTKSNDLAEDHWLQIECTWFLHVCTFLARSVQSIGKIMPLISQNDPVSRLPVHLVWETLAYKKDSPQIHVNGIYKFLVHKLEGSVKLKQLQKIPMHIRKAAVALSLEQLASLITYLDMRDLRKKQALIKFATFPLDKFGRIYLALRARKMWKIKMLMAPKRNVFEDFSLVPYHIAKNNFLYRDVMHALTPRARVIMNSLGEITFCPIKHCRWCGQANVKQFRVCPECRDTPDYPDLNFFCSETCEKQCLQKQHIEEHAKYFMMLIGLID